MAGKVKRRTGKHLNLKLKDLDRLMETKSSEELRKIYATIERDVRGAARRLKKQGATEYEISTIFSLPNIEGKTKYLTQFNANRAKQWEEVRGVARTTEDKAAFLRAALKANEGFYKAEKFDLSALRESQMAKINKWLAIANRASGGNRVTYDYNSFTREQFDEISRLFDKLIKTIEQGKNKYFDVYEKENGEKFIRYRKVDGKYHTNILQSNSSQDLINRLKKALEDADKEAISMSKPEKLRPSKNKTAKMKLDLSSKNIGYTSLLDE